jgi:hypothetical protein
MESAITRDIPSEVVCDTYYYLGLIGGVMIILAGIIMLYKKNYSGASYVIVVGVISLILNRMFPYIICTRALLKGESA